MRAPLLSYLLMTLVLCAVQVSAQTVQSGPITPDFEWIAEWIEENYPVVADPAHAAADLQRAINRDTHARARRVLRRANKTFLLDFFSEEEIDTIVDHNPNSSLADWSADRVDSLPPLFDLPQPDINKPSRTTPSQEPIRHSPVVIDSEPDIKKPGKKPPAGSSPSPFDGPTPSEPALADDQPDIKKPVSKEKRKSTSLAEQTERERQCARANGGYGTPAYYRCLGDEGGARLAEQTERERRCARANGGYGTPAYYRCLGDEGGARLAEQTERERRCARANGGYGTIGYRRCLGI